MDVKAFNASIDVITRQVEAGTGEALAKATRLLRSQAQVITPVKTGRLQASAKDILVDNSPPDYSAEVTYNTHYAAFVHKRKPYLANAIDQNKSDMVQVMKETLRAAITG